MQTFDEMHDKCNRAGHPCAYWGERGAWLVVCGRHRDSDALEESNFIATLKRLGGESDTVAIEQESHWAVGWVEHLLVNPADIARVEMAQEIRDGLEDYPVVDDETFFQVEHDRFWDWAWSELGRFEGWEWVIDELDRNGNFFIGEDSSEWKLIEAAREQLESTDTK